MEKVKTRKSFQKETFYLKKKVLVFPIVLFPGGSMEATMLCVFQKFSIKKNDPYTFLSILDMEEINRLLSKILKKEVLEGYHWALSYSEHAQKTLR